MNTEYYSVIINELREVVAYCDSMKQEEIDELLEMHEEYSISCISDESSY